MRTNLEPTDEYIRAAIDRMEPQVSRRLRVRRTKTIAISAAAVLVAGGASVAAGLAWPNAAEQPYIVCMQTADLSHGNSSEGVGFDMSDPVGYCRTSAIFDDLSKPGQQYSYWHSVPRDDLAACKLSVGVAGVFKIGTDFKNCDSLGLTPWTAADVAAAKASQTHFDKSNGVLTK
jgi:hypothetical protein